MLILHAVPHSLYCAKTRIALRAKSLAWREVAPEGGAASTAYRALVPSGNLPALTHGDMTLSDSEAIAEYLDEAFPAPPLLPRGLVERARTRERGRFHDTRLEPALRLLFGQVTRPDPAVTGPAAQGVTARLAQLAQLLTHDLPFGLGDCGYPPTFLWIEVLDRALGLGVVWPEAVLRYRTRLCAVPSVAEELSAYHLHVKEWMDSKHSA